MDRWYRVFAGPALPDPQVVRTALGATGTFEADGDGWYLARLITADGQPLTIDRYRADEEGIRAELNSWAAWVETCGDDRYHTGLMEQLIQTAQLFLFALPEGTERFGEDVCRVLANATGGIYQIDGRGLFEADGTLLVAEEPSYRESTERA
jgi:hypothetical protein